MNEPRERFRVRGAPGERGGARLNFMIILVLIAAVIYVGVQYVPVAYHARAFEAFMQDTVNMAAITNKNPAWVEQQLRRGLEDYSVPADATIKSVQSEARLEATVQYTQPISLLFTEYDYTFDKTVRSATVVSGGQ